MSMLFISQNINTNLTNNLALFSGDYSKEIWRCKFIVSDCPYSSVRVPYKKGAKMAQSNIDISKYENRLSFGNRMGRAIWNVVWLIFFRASPVICFPWRRFLLRLFGARIGKKASIYPSAKIWAPWNLEMGDYSCLSRSVDCYSVDKIIIGTNATVSQYAYLCTASHDITDPHMKLVTAPITIGNGAWICASAFIGPGIKVGEGAVAGACSVVTKDIPAWMVVGGNPACIIKKRDICEQGVL